MIRRLVPLLVTLLVLGALAWTMYFLVQAARGRLSSSAAAIG